MPEILATAENFAFGPVGKLTTVTDKLRKQGHDITFIGYGTALQIASKSNFSNVIEMDTDSPDFEQQAKGIFEQYEILLSCMDRASILLAKGVSLPTIWLDTLFWWWNEIPEFLSDVDLYIKQNTLGDQKNVETYQDKIKHLRGVGPIVDTQYRHQREHGIKQALVAFGGMEGNGWYKVGKDSQYPYTLTELLVNKTDFSKFDRVVVTGNERIIEELRSRYAQDSKFVFLTLGHQEFLQQLGKSSVALMVPGLETPLEAFCYQVPTIFLPPLIVANMFNLMIFKVMD